MMVLHPLYLVLSSEATEQVLWGSIDILMMPSLIKVDKDCHFKDRLNSVLQYHNIYNEHNSFVISDE